ncbi:MAG: acetyl-CoA carboxylase biotin carboxyl carrier protein [Gemmataceae bacterium]
MPNETPASPRPFDAKVVEHLVGLMDTHQLSEISLVEGDRRIRLRKGMPATMMAVPAAPMMPAAAPTPAAAVGTAPVAPAEPAKPKANYHEVKSPMVGTFYSKPNPEKPDYVSTGSAVKPDTVICKLEAMKIFNDLTADVAGTIAEVCVKNGQPVEFGTVLFRINLG